MILGHESSGIITVIHPDCTVAKTGMRVAIEPGIPCRSCTFCKSGKYNLCDFMRFAATPPYNGTLQRFYDIPEDFVYDLGDLSYLEGALMEPLAVAVHVVNRLKINHDKGVVIFGAGAIGLLCAAVSTVRGSKHVLMIDIAADKLEFARKFLPNVTTHLVSSERIHDEVSDSNKRTAATIMTRNTWLRDYGGAHCIVEATGAEPCMQLGIELARKGSIFVQVGMGRTYASVPMGTVCAKEMTVLGSFRYTNDCFLAGIAMVKSGAINLKQLVTNEYTFCDAVSAFWTVANGKSGVIKVLIRGQGFESDCHFQEQT